MVCAALLGGLAGLAAPRAGRRWTPRPAPTPPAPTVAPVPGLTAPVSSASAGSVPPAGASAGSVPPAGASAGSVPPAGASAGSVPPAGASAGSVPPAGASAGSVPPAGASAGSVPPAGASAGSVPPAGASAGSVPPAGASAGAVPSRATGGPLVAVSGASAGAGAAVGAVVFAGLAAALDNDPALPAFLGLAAVGLVLAVVDLACLRLPDPLVGAAALVVAVGLAGAALLTGAPERLFGAMAGAALSFAAYVLLALLPGSRLGFGDVKLAGVLGLPLGWLGWSPLALGLILPHLLNGVVVVVLLAARRVRRDTPLPLGPALLTGAWLTTLLT
ncbi:leader peptidase (prepilin peptidase) / N-methyltransferase [Micromonospora citrea]|uniref:Leader peptidase (Prepilin peptidase) / N-methyltransferase n=1 Tax=Micromonospora citrea TaxID=47855 RepID=A0A1C6V2W4_9ACTN|nr:leader peptidase (prepilin peptidase) / N-methyltransferase [Micromonospora citrea]